MFFCQYYSFKEYIRYYALEASVLFDIFHTEENEEKSEKIHGAPVASSLQKADILKKNTLIFGGDVMLSRYVDVLMYRNNDYKAPFKDIADFMSKGDITFINLESPFKPNPTHFSTGMIFGADMKALEGVLFAGIDIVSLANNHFGDAGKNGMEYTMEELTKNGIYFTGAGRNDEEAQAPTYIASNGLIFAFYAYSDISPYYAAGNNTPGYAKIPEPEALKNSIEKAKRLADIVIISVHTGTEYTKTPSSFFMDFAHSAVDYGATLVIGHHPHVIQPVEYYKNGVIFYSLGNLVFDQYFSGTKEGILAQVDFENTAITNVIIQPIIIEDLWKARLANEKETEIILTKTQW